MKKYILMPVLAALSLSGSVAQAQDFDNKPVVNVSNSKENLNFTIGARFMMDGAYYHSDFTPVKSGAAITDARIRTSMSYEDWYFYADFDFSKGKFSQKNIFLQYSLEGAKGTHRFKAGYYNNPASMANNTSRGSLHFISRSAAANAFSPSRELGLSYIFYNNHFFANQGVFAENKYNDQPSGYQGMSFGGRWVWRPINNEDRTFHVGAAFRYANIATGVVENNVLKTELDLGSSLETYVDATQDFLSAKLPWAKNVFDVGAEFYTRQITSLPVVNICTNMLPKNVTTRHCSKLIWVLSTLGAHSKHGRKVIRSVRTLSTELISKPVTKSSAIRINTAIPMLC